MNPCYGNTARNLQCRVPDVSPHGSPPLLAAVDGVEFAGRGRHLPHLPLRGRRRAASHLTLLLRWVPALCSPVMPAAVDQELGHSVLRTVQVPVHHAHQDQTLQKVGEAGDVPCGAA
ncbi:hypothetical protein TNCT_10021 [Trichonephila clavata]|uniref:Uncharacterized protein n=1 Tax=Trichonephila clavata TaxID=2740835 RepID=A0A8X6J2D5_TRICU|nr:hypothetical protein TNCT_10021 [Trichonephila clavata]